MQDETTQAIHNEPTGELAGDTTGPGETDPGETAHHDASTATLAVNADSAWMRYMEECRAATAELRASCLAELRALGVEQVEAAYSGYGDSGNVDDIRLEPALADMQDELRRRLDELIWRTAYLVSPGFEINDGGSGTLCWRIAEDDITVDHCTYYTAEDHSYHENL